MTAYDLQDFLHVAKKFQQLASGTTFPEAYSRCAMSRCYYAAYWACRKVLEDQNKIQRVNLKNDKSSHAKVIEEMHNLKNMGPNARYSLWLKELKKLRENADYDEVMAFGKNDLRDMLYNASEIIKWAKKHSTKWP